MISAAGSLIDVIHSLTLD